MSTKLPTIPVTRSSITPSLSSTPPQPLTLPIDFNKLTAETVRAIVNVEAICNNPDFEYTPRSSLIVSPAPPTRLSPPQQQSGSASSSPKKVAAMSSVHSRFEYSGARTSTSTTVGNARRSNDNNINTPAGSMPGSREDAAAAGSMSGSPRQLLKSRNAAQTQAFPVMATATAAVRIPRSVCPPAHYINNNNINTPTRTIGHHAHASSPAFSHKQGMSVNDGGIGGSTQPAITRGFGITGLRSKPVLWSTAAAAVIDQPATEQAVESSTPSSLADNNNNNIPSPLSQPATPPSPPSTSHSPSNNNNMPAAAQSPPLTPPVEECNRNDKYQSVAASPPTPPPLEAPIAALTRTPPSPPSPPPAFVVAEEAPVTLPPVVTSSGSPRPASSMDKAAVQSHAGSRVLSFSPPKKHIRSNNNNKPAFEYKCKKIIHNDNNNNLNFKKASSSSGNHHNNNNKQQAVPQQQQHTGNHVARINAAPFARFRRTSVGRQLACRTSVVHANRPQRPHHNTITPPRHAPMSINDTQPLPGSKAQEALEAKRTSMKIAAMRKDSGRLNNDRRELGASTPGLSDHNNNNTGGGDSSSPTPVTPSSPSPTPRSRLDSPPTSVRRSGRKRKDRSYNELDEGEDEVGNRSRQLSTSSPSPRKSPRLQKKLGSEGAMRNDDDDYLEITPVSGRLRRSASADVRTGRATKTAQRGRVTPATQIKSPTTAAARRGPKATASHSPPRPQQQQQAPIRRQEQARPAPSNSDMLRDMMLSAVANGLVDESSAARVLLPDPTDSEAEETDEVRPVQRAGQKRRSGRDAADTAERSPKSRKRAHGSAAGRASRLANGGRRSRVNDDDSNDDDDDFHGNGAGPSSCQAQRGRSRTAVADRNANNGDDDGDINDDDDDDARNDESPGAGTLLDSEDERDRTRRRMKLVVVPLRTRGRRKRADGTAAAEGKRTAAANSLGGKQKKEYPERMFTQMESEELSTLRMAFVEYYVAPPANLHAQASLELELGIKMSRSMIQGLWRYELKPWSDTWWKLYSQFNEEARDRKRVKPRTTNPTVRMSDAKRWAKAFYRRNGEARPDNLIVYDEENRGRRARTAALRRLAQKYDEEEEEGSE